MYWEISHYQHVQSFPKQKKNVEDWLSHIFHLYIWGHYLWLARPLKVASCCRYQGKSALKCLFFKAMEYVFNLPCHVDLTIKPFLAKKSLCSTSPTFPLCFNWRSPLLIQCQVHLSLESDAVGLCGLHWHHCWVPWCFFSGQGFFRLDGEVRNITDLGKTVWLGVTLWLWRLMTMLNAHEPTNTNIHFKLKFSSKGRWC